MILNCPFCKKETFWENNTYRPFCSDECKKRDLGEWARESYYISGESTHHEKVKKEEE